MGTAAGRTFGPLLNLSRVQYSYPSGLTAVGGVDLSVGQGEIVAIVGPSGCGKSTLLSLIGDLAQPSRGSIEWTDSAEHRDRRLAMVFQRDTVFPWRTVNANIQYGMECLGMPKHERRQWTADLLKLGRLEGFGDVYPKSLSGGMRRRVALLMSLAVRPSVLLLDEPFSGLDEPTRVELLADVLKLARELKLSAVMVTHDLGEAITIADRIVVMSQRPTTVRKEVRVDFGSERNVYEIREAAEYAALYSELWHALWASIRGEL